MKIFDHYSVLLYNSTSYTKEQTVIEWSPKITMFSSSHKRISKEFQTIVASISHTLCGSCIDEINDTPPFSSFHSICLTLKMDLKYVVVTYKNISVTDSLLSPEVPFSIFHSFSFSYESLQDIHCLHKIGF